MLTSHAQNFEDVILWRVLKNVETGFYIDIGAQDPVTDSVSLAFYEKGWKGVHVEPSPAYADVLRKNRPDEVVIEAIVGEQSGNIRFYEIAGTGLSTADAEVAARHATNGHPLVTRLIPGLRLATILDTYQDREIHWLKIDVEEFERSVILSWEPSRVRPWVVVVEATLPNTQTPSHESWEPELLKLGYEFVYFDGLNRFYVSHNQRHLAELFGPGPNYFDDFQMTKLSVFNRQLVHELREEHDAELRNQVAGYQNELVRLQSETVTLQNELIELRGNVLEQSNWREHATRRIDVLSAEITKLHLSRSWRMTKPLRWMSLMMQKFWFRA